MNNWNVQTSTFLRRYVYERFIDPENPKETTTPMLITFMTSAFWHGFYPIYYLVFFYLHILLVVARKIYKHRDYFWWWPSKIL